MSDYWRKVAPAQLLDWPKVNKVFVDDITPPPDRYSPYIIHDSNREENYGVRMFAFLQETNERCKKE